MAPLTETSGFSINSSLERNNLKNKIHTIGSYKLLETLGIGEFGKVKLAQHVHTGEKVAIKMIDKNYTEKVNIRDKVDREIALLKKLSHPSIVKLFDVIETERYIGMVMEYASGGELFEYILTRDYLKEQVARDFFGQLISSVHYMHQKGVVHRDLKLENVLLFDDQRHIVITDFGFANNCTGQEDLLRTCCGSPCYAAPELLVGSEYVGPAVDIWSCGVVLYAMLCGFLPFDDHNNMSLLYKDMLEAPLVFPSRISPDARDLLRQMLEPNPEHRCKMEIVLAHPWLENQRTILEKSLETLETEAMEMSRTNWVAKKSTTIAGITPEEEEGQGIAVDNNSIHSNISIGALENVEKPQQSMKVAPLAVASSPSPPEGPSAVQPDDNIPKLQLSKRQRFFRLFYLIRKEKDTHRNNNNTSRSSSNSTHSESDDVKQRRRFTWSLTMRRGDRKRKNRESNNSNACITRVHPESLLVFSKISDHQLLTLVLRVLTILGIHIRQDGNQQIACIRQPNDSGTVYGSMENGCEVTFIVDINYTASHGLRSIGIRHQEGQEVAYEFLCGKIMGMLELLLEPHHHHHQQQHHQQQQQ
ncbi:kinase-like domain-containing protein [Circinella umbellata]|nr:kinase-like domain-containing protein [Circinella umbellata]